MERQLANQAHIKVHLLIHYIRIRSYWSAVEGRLAYQEHVEVSAACFFVFYMKLCSLISQLGSY